MILKPYPEYKESGVSWIGPIPKHWEVHPNRALFSERNIKNNNGQELLSVTIKKGVIRQVDLLLNSSKKDSSNEDKSNYKLVKPGDLVYNKMRMWQGAVGASKYEGIVSPAYIIVHPREGMDEWYYHYLFRSPLYIKESYRYSYGICDDQLSLRIDDFKKIFTPKPPLKEQKQIVRFINYKSAQISRFIRAKRRIIELLKEQKQAIINQAVTRGLDPNVKLKPSGVEWLGEIPEHWKLIKLKHIASLKSGINITSESIDKQGIYPVYGGNGLRGYTTNYTHDGFHILIGRQGALCGNINYACGKFWASEHAIVVTPKINLEIYWLGELLRAMNLNQYSIAAAQPGLSVERIINLLIPLPSLDEQKQISEWINYNVKNLDQKISCINREISLIQEYRARLIADVVTGKVDVRDIEVPDVADEELAIEDLDGTEDAEETIEEAEDEE